MTESTFTFEKISGDLTGHINLSKGFKIWMAFLVISLGICLMDYW